MKTNLFAWILSAVTPIAKELLVGLGFGFMTYTGVSLAFDSMVSSLRNQVSQIPPDILVYSQMSGIWSAMGLVLAAISFKITFTVFSRLQKIK